MSDQEEETSECLGENSICGDYANGVYWEMIIVETPIFTKRVTGILGVEDYRLLQSELVLRPESGKIIPGSGGLRKLRWTGSGRGKRGGSRLIYYYMRDNKVILMLFIYAKNETEDLTKDQIKVLRSIVEEELK